METARANMFPKKSSSLQGVFSSVERDQ